jgi:hypothetical protein
MVAHVHGLFDYAGEIQEKVGPRGVNPGVARQ